MRWYYITFDGKEMKLVIIISFYFSLKQMKLNTFGENFYLDLIHQKQSFRSNICHFSHINQY